LVAGGGAGRWGGNLCAAVVFPVFFLSLLYPVYFSGWAMFTRKTAPPLSEELTRVPVPSWMRKFQSAYSSNMLVGLTSALFSPSRAVAIEAEKTRVTYWMLLKDFCVALVPFALIAGTLWLALLYVF